MSGGLAMDSLTYRHYKGSNQLRQIRDIVADNAYNSHAENLIADIDNQADSSSRLGMYKYPDNVSGGPDDRWTYYSGSTLTVACGNTN